MELFPEYSAIVLSALQNILYSTRRLVGVLEQSGLSGNTADGLHAACSGEQFLGAHSSEGPPKQVKVGYLCCHARCNDEGGRGGGRVGERKRKTEKKKREIHIFQYSYCLRSYQI